MRTEMNMKHWLAFLGLITGVCAVSDDAVDWRAINTSNVCPNIDVCGVETTRGEEEMCCGGCSCDENCDRNKNCCYKGGTYTKCIPTTIYPDTVAYYMETTEPNNVTNGKLPEFLFKPCIDSRRPDWLQILPVYSNSTRRLYVNGVCAESHGVFDYNEVTHVSLICGVGDEPTDSGALINEAVVSIYNNDLPRGCFVNIRMPRIDYIRRSECNAGIVDVCSPDYVESENDDPISRACTSDFHSVVGAIVAVDTIRLFKNPFCAACNNHTVVTMRECTGKNSFIDEPDLPDNKFTLLVDPRKLKPFHQTSLTPQTARKQVCLNKNGKINLETCRPVLCPWGQVRDSNGSCVWLSRSITVDRYFVTLKLTPNSALRETELESSTIGRSNISNPWPQKWMLHRIEYTLDKNYVNFINYFYVVMYIKGSESDVEEIIQMVEMYSVKNWTIKFHDEYMTFTSNISKTKFNHDSYTYTFLAPEETPLNDAIISISAISFCRQVQLSADEFTHNQLSNSIISVLTDRKYRDGEFMFVSDRHGTLLPRVCLDDSGFVDSPNTAGSLVILEIYVFVVLMNLWVVFSILY